MAAWTTHDFESVRQLPRSCSRTIQGHLVAAGALSVAAGALSRFNFPRK